MKKLALLLSVLFVFNSCSLDEETFALELLPVESVVIPAEFELGGAYQITMKYYRPTSCHSPYGFYYERELNVRTCAVQNLKSDRADCNIITDYLVEETFTFHATNTGNYIFKFWTGKDEEGNNTYLEYDIPVN